MDSLMNKFINRADVGKNKYGVTLDRTDLSLDDWIVHAQEEFMDALLYLEKIKEITNKNYKKETNVIYKDDSIVNSVLNKIISEKKEDSWLDKAQNDLLDNIINLEKMKKN